VTPLPGRLGDGSIVGWRIDDSRHAATWDSGEGAFRVGGRWNSPGVRTVYCSADPATAILEVAVHKGFRVLDTVPHTLTSFRIDAPDRIHIVRPEDVPNPNWLRPGTPSAGQMAFGDNLLKRHPVVLIPSAVSSHSWNLLFLAGTAGAYKMLAQERLALDPRLHPPV